MNEFFNDMEIFSLGFKVAEKAAKMQDFFESKELRIIDKDVLISGIMLKSYPKMKKILKKFKE